MKKTPIQQNDRLIKGSEINSILAIATTTRERMKKDGRLPEPDVRGKNGAADKWLHSKIMQVLDVMVNGEGTAA